MTRRYAVTHTTHYSYGHPVAFGLHMARLSPAEGPGQRLVSHAVEVTPHPAWAVAFTDHFGNAMQHIAIETAHDALTVTQRTLVDVLPPPWRDLPAGPAWESVRDAMDSDSFSAFPAQAEFIHPSPHVPRAAAATAYARASFPPGAPLAAAAFDLARRFKADFAYAPGTTGIETGVGEVMEMRRGVCQDFSHAMIAGLRGLGLPARYVSGYLKTHAGDADVPRLGADATHAWVSVWCGPELAWIGFDPTNALVVADEHIAVACGRDFSDVTPLRGVIMGGGMHTLSVGVTVEDAPAA